jgi:hypothetical protein
MDAARPSLDEAANAPTIRDATKLPKLPARAAQIFVAKTRKLVKRKIGRFPMYTAVGTQMKF